LLDNAEFPATGAGYQQMLTWMRGLGQLSRVGVEGTGSYGAGLTRYLCAEGIPVIEVNRTNPSTRRQRAKSDPIDAEATGHRRGRTPPGCVRRPPSPPSAGPARSLSAAAN
jgi:transposase